MILWSNLLGALVLVAAATHRMLRRPPRARRDADWGDWPPDQMAP